MGPLVEHRLGKELESRVVAVWVDKAIVEEVLSHWFSGRRLVTWCPRLPNMSPKTWLHLGNAYHLCFLVSLCQATVCP